MSNVQRFGVFFHLCKIPFSQHENEKFVTQKKCLKKYLCPHHKMLIRDSFCCILAPTLVYSTICFHSKQNLSYYLLYWRIS